VLLRPLILVGALVGRLGAQTADTTKRDSAVTLPPVVVSAARSDRSVFALPLAVSQIDRRALFGAAGRGLDEALSLVPGVVAQSRAGGSDVRITIRGYGARGAGDRSNAGTTRGIRILLDGFPETEPDGRTSLDGIDLASTHAIEVVRSNASAVWGNAAGGVINVSTMPPPGAHMTESDLAAGTFGLRSAALRGSARAGGEGQLAFSLVRSRFDGWRAHSASSRTLANLAYRTADVERTRLGVYATASDNFYEIPGPLTAAQVAADERQANPTYLARRERRHNRVGRIGVSLAHDASRALGLDGVFYVQPKFLQRSERGTFRDFTRYHLGAQAGLRVVTPFGARVSGVLRGAVDAAYQDGAVLFYSLSAAGNRGDTLRNNQREAARTVGAYVQEEVDFGAWGVTLGARFDDVTYIAEDYLVPALAARKSFSHLSPKLGVTYRLGPFHSVYAALGGGIEAPAGNETDPASTFGQDTVTALNPLLEPIRSTTYELGTRRTVRRDGVLRVVSYDVALYDTRVRDEIVPYRGGRFYFSAGRVRRAGVELGLSARTESGVAVQGTLAYAHHRYREYVVDSVHYGRPGALADYTGHQVVGVPALTYGVSAEAAPAFVAPLWVRASVQGQSSYFADDANAVRVAGFKIVSAALGLHEAVRVGPLGLRGYISVHNLLDRRYTSSAFLNPDVVAGEPVAFEPGMPRNWTVGMSLSPFRRATQ
jgi:iron complex outermembrane receptor protein